LRKTIFHDGGSGADGTARSGAQPKKDSAEEEEKVPSKVTDGSARRTEDGEFDRMKAARSIFAESRSSGLRALGKSDRDEAQRFLFPG
jgi:hypothetical protein